MLGSYIQYTVELIFGITLFVKAILFIPQAIKIYRAKQAKELSLLTFGGLSFMQLLTALHAYYHHDYVLMFGVLFSLFFCSAITFMIVIYR